MIQKADIDMLPRLKRIWQSCFEEDKKSVDFVFDNLLNPAQMLVETDDSGRPVAMVNWKLLRFTTPRQAFPGAYIFGVATLPEHRGRGISTALIEKAHDLLKEEGAELACLIPATPSLFGFYAARGFETGFRCKELRLSREDIPAPHAEGVLSAAKLEELAGLREAAFSGRALFGAWGADYLRYTGMECRFYGGDVLRFSSGGRQGYAVCYPRGENTLLVKEAVVDRDDIDILLSALHARYRAGRYELRLPVDFAGGNEWEHEILPFAMVKWYDRENSRKVSLGDASWFAFGLE